MWVMLYTIIWIRVLGEADMACDVQQYYKTGCNWTDKSKSKSEEGNTYEQIGRSIVRYQGNDKHKTKRKSNLVGYRNSRPND